MFDLFEEDELDRALLKKELCFEGCDRSIGNERKKNRKVNETTNV